MNGEIQHLKRLNAQAKDHINRLQGQLDENEEIKANLY